MTRNERLEQAKFLIGILRENLDNARPGGLITIYIELQLLCRGMAALDYSIIAIKINSIGSELDRLIQLGFNYEYHETKLKEKEEKELEEKLL